MERLKSNHLENKEMMIRMGYKSGKLMRSKHGNDYRICRSKGNESIVCVKCKIYTPGNFYAWVLIDEDELDLLNKYRFSILIKKTSIIVYCGFMALSYFILNTKKHIININGLDCRKSNLMESITQNIRYNNKTGIVGVSLCDDKGIPTWIAHIKIGNIYQKKTFSTRKYGYDKAFQLALDARKKMEAEIEI